MRVFHHQVLGTFLHCAAGKKALGRVDLGQKLYQQPRQGSEREKRQGEAVGVFALLRRLVVVAGGSIRDEKNGEAAVNGLE